MIEHPDDQWLRMIRRYLIATTITQLAWEVVQLPLYTLWQTGTAGEIVFAVVHCTAGDVAIASASLVFALVVAGSSDWPARRFAPVLAWCAAFGVVYTTYSEYLNVSVRHLWAYSVWMPLLPGVGTGLAPLAQWALVPIVALHWTRSSTRTTAG